MPTEEVIALSAANQNMRRAESQSGTVDKTLQRPPSRLSPNALPHCSSLGVGEEVMSDYLVLQLLPASTGPEVVGGQVVLGF